MKVDDATKNNLINKITIEKRISHLIHLKKPNYSE